MCPWPEFCKKHATKNATGRCETHYTGCPGYMDATLYGVGEFPEDKVKPAEIVEEEGTKCVDQV